MEYHKALNRAHLGSFPNDDVSSDGMHYICRVFDVAVKVSSAAEKYTLVAAKLYRIYTTRLIEINKSYLYLLIPIEYHMTKNQS
ncbi:MAG: hypothetical protein WB988_12210 [Candidatus Nitrosopolaris sp.]